MAQRTKHLPNECGKEQSLDLWDDLKLSTSVHACNPRGAVGGGRQRQENP